MKRICEMTSCGRDHYAKGLCLSHYKRRKRYGSPSGGGTLQGEPMAFLSAAAASSDDKCILWPYGIARGGYGQVWEDGRHVAATHVVLKMVGHDRPSDLHHAAHDPTTCNNPSCVNPKHLRWATADENIADQLTAGTRQPRGGTWDGKAI